MPDTGKSGKALDEIIGIVVEVAFAANLYNHVRSFQQMVGAQERF